MEYEKNENLAATGSSAMANACRITKVFTSKDRFFGLAPIAYRQYYLSVVRKNQQFYDGYVYGLHNSSDGIFSYCLGGSLCHNFAEKIAGKGLAFSSRLDTLEHSNSSKVARWGRAVGFQTFATKAIDYCLGLGNALIKLNVSRKSDYVYWPQAVRADDYVFVEDGFGELQDVKSMVKCYMHGDYAYYLVEHRFYKDGRKTERYTTSEGKAYDFVVGDRVAVARYEVFRTVGNSVNGTVETIGDYSPIGHDALPKEVLKSINKDFGAYKLDEDITLPFPNLGAWQLKNEGYDSKAPGVPFGASLISRIYTELAEYDMYCSAANLDVHNGRGQVFTPKEMNIETGEMGVYDGTNKIHQKESEAYPKRMNMETFNGDPDNFKPVINQFKIRSEEWNAKIDNLLKRIAIKINASPKIIASFLTQDANKTATEIDSDNDSIVDWIEIKRNAFAMQFDAMIETYCNAMGITGECRVKFGAISGKPMSSVINEVTKLLDYGIITKRDAVKLTHPDKGEDEIDVYMDLLSKEEEAKDLLLTPEGDAR